MTAECLAGPGEPLKQHLLEVAGCVAEEGKYVAQKLARSFGLRPEEAEDLLYYTALMHDVGKADANYDDKTGYYPLHEAKSVAIIYATFKKLGVVNGCSLTVRDPTANPYLLVLLSVALHHYSHKSFDNKEVSVGFKRRCDDVLAALREWKPKSDLGKRLRENTLEVLEKEIQADLCFGALVTSLRRSTGSPKTRKAAMAVLGVLNKCDIDVAKSRRLKT